MDKQLISLWLDTAALLLDCGAEIHRAEDTLSRLAAAYGAARADVFVITSCISVTFTYEGEDPYTLTRRITAPGSTDFARLEKLNALTRRACRERLDAAQYAALLSEIRHDKAGLYKQLIGSALSSGAFCLFFGGHAPDGALAAVFGLLMCLLLRFLSRAGLNRTAQCLISSFCMGIPICLISRLFPALLPDKIIVGVIMLTIPGIATTNSIRDMLMGDTISGTLRLTQSLIEAFIIAGSYMLSVRVTGANVTYAGAQGGIWQLFAAGAGSFGFAFIFNCRRKFAYIAVPGGMLCWLVYLTLQGFAGLDVFLCSLISALICDILAEVCARVFKAPATLFLIPFLVPLIPGCSLFYALSAFAGGTGGAYARVTFMAVTGIALGVGICAGATGLIYRKKHSVF